MFTTICGKCGTEKQLEEAQVPAVGLVLKCRTCGQLNKVARPAGPGAGPNAPSNEIVDLPAPRLSPGLIDLPAPRRNPERLTPEPRPMPAIPPLVADDSDLLAPVGPLPTRGLDLPAPVGPVSTRSIPELPVPVGPVSTRSMPELPVPVGPVPTRGLSDLPAPVGPVPTHALPELPVPVGPMPTRGTSDLPVPVGPIPTRAMPELPAPVGPWPTKAASSLAPKGFFDDMPPPRGGAGPAVPNLELQDLSDELEEDDDLDLVPAGQAPLSANLLEVPASARDASAPKASGPLPQRSAGGSEGDFTTSSGSAGALSFGEVDLPPPDPDAGVVSFAPAQARANDRQSEPEAPSLAPLTLAGAGAPRRSPDGSLTKPIKSADAPAAFHQTARRQRNRRLLIGGALALAVLGGGGFFVYENVELEIAGFRTAPAQERYDHIQAGASTARALLLDDQRGHWYRAASAAEAAEQWEPDKKKAELPGLDAEAYAAAAIDEGLNAKVDRDKADAVISGLLKMGAKGGEMDKAEALRSVLDLGKAKEAYAKLALLAQADPADPNLPLYMGWAASAAGDNVLAKSAFSKALLAVPDRQPALYGLGRALLALGETDAARQALQKAFDRHPNARHFGAWLGLIEIDTPPRDHTGQREKELGALCEHAPERESAHPKDHARAWRLYADEAMAAARFDQAGERYRTARALDPTDNAALVGGALASIELRSQAAVRGLELTEARRDLEQALKVDPAQVDALVGLARIDLYEGKAVEARKLIEQAISIDDNRATAHYWHGRILEDPAFSSVDADKAYARAITLAPKDYAAYVALSQLYAARSVDAAKANRRDEAKQWSERAVATLAPIADAAKSDAKLADTLGNAYIGAKDTAHAIEWFRVAVASAPDSPDTHAYLGSALLDSGDIADAKAELEKAHALAPRREDITLAMATAHEKDKDFATAEKLYAQLLSTDSGNIPSVTARAAAGRFYARRDLVSLAQQQGQLIAGAEPQNPTGHFLVGYGFLAAGRLVEAQKELRDAVAVDPQAQYLEALGRCYEQQKSFTEAEIAFDQSARLDPSYAAPILGLAHIHLARREFSAAVTELEKARVLTPDDMDIWIGLGDAHFALRELAEAAAAYEHALAHDDKRPELWFKLGKVNFESDTGDTVGRLRGAIERAPAGTTWVPEAYRMLGFYFRARTDLGQMCAAFAKYLALAPPTDLMYEEVKRSHAGCP